MKKAAIILFILTIISTQMKSQMQEAYNISGYIVKERLTSENKDNERVIKDISKKDLVVVQGTYDHIHLVLSSLNLPYSEITQTQLKDIKLEPQFSSRRSSSSGNFRC